MIYILYYLLIGCILNLLCNLFGSDLTVEDDVRNTFLWPAPVSGSIGAIIRWIFRR